MLNQNRFNQTSILLRKSLRLTRNCCSWTRSNYQQVWHKEVGQNQNTFQILVSGKFSTNDYAICTCFAENMASKWKLKQRHVNLNNFLVFSLSRGNGAQSSVSWSWLQLNTFRQLTSNLKQLRVYEICPDNQNIEILFHLE